ncbi:MAG: hypothetical protein K8F92_00210 [Hyphomicrobium sp.]|uniref:hypothetical protein n=1 Tax=Hyphomicrobium sp. TaxID=82 RepID=UPI00132B703E|nr:hypothetical protein [Hyphomicrobium sp.]KAB2939657.1 MAG: hypothetical protein F9K20_16045 [Hyphomicrobium sp.]MBZ0208067.1 hypothetical protein [Hyphomicrobium sp.]MCZ7593580.1 hypothetical protein [Hyphomicrobium sp.]
MSQILRPAALLRALAAVCALVAATGMPTRAEDAAAAAGTYCLTGVHEVGSCMRLSPDGTFEYFLAYGAYDESAEGTWQMGKGEVIVTTPAYDKRPAFSFKRMQPSGTDAFDVIVESQSGQPIAGVDVSVTCDGQTKSAGVTQAGGFAVDCAGAPMAIALGLGMFGIALQTLDVSAHAGTDKAYVFAFEPGDLGKKAFAAQRLRVDGDALEMTYADTPIRELQGRPFRYVRER